MLAQKTAEPAAVTVLSIRVGVSREEFLRVQMLQAWSLSLAMYPLLGLWSPPFSPFGAHVVLPR